jgi:mRNA interferase HigB
MTIQDKFTFCELIWMILSTFAMKIHLIRKETIEVFARRNTQSRTSLSEWLTRLKYADWQDPSHIQESFPGTDLLGKGSNRVVFNIAGNRYRLICKYVFGDREVHLFISWIGTHAEYDNLCGSDKQYTVSEF